MPTQKKQSVTGWGNYPRVESFVLPVRDISDAGRSVKDGNIIPRGLGRSYADQAVNDGGRIAECTFMNHFLNFDEQEGILECEAGASLEEIINVFVGKGWLPMICPGTKFVTLGGAIANDIHGKAHHTDGSFVNCVISFTILTASGDILTASRTENSDLFWANFGGLGLLGIIVTAKIRLRKIETTYFRQKSIKINNLTEMLEALEQYDHEFNYSVAWIDALAKGSKLGSGVLTLGNAAKLSELPPELQKDPLKLHNTSKLSVPVYLPDFSLNGVTVKVLNKAISIVQNSSKKFVHYEKFFFPLDAINNWNRGYGKRGFIQYQFVIPVENGKENLIKILTSIGESGCIPFLNVFKKMGKGQGILSFPFEGYTLAIDFPMTKQLPAFIRKLDQEVLKANGRIYLGKDAMLDSETFRLMYPQYKEWLAIKKKYDPENIFTSNIGRRIKLTSHAV
ncbi:MAG: FAD-binding oxidoreductase [Chitinophagaceae bacterium]|nr:FAD-binding oxidoreductase [Chitinophagaceae bacterium]